ncbi:MAG: 4a-hydroxytetrahydrobiopterin dehydratase [Verrucomicrobium sp.]|nr:4a-hydroxytetrahydrobiopterin dehydratase [Verrucomicrobium sp.]
MEMNLVLGAWKEDEAGLHKTFQFQDFRHALSFLVEVGRLAEQAGHHPDVDLRYNKVSLTLLTHSAGRITEKDHSLAAEIDRLPLERIAAGSRALFTAG